MIRWEWGPTPELRWHDRFEPIPGRGRLEHKGSVLQQKWVARRMGLSPFQKSLFSNPQSAINPYATREEWRDVPTVGGGK